MPKTPKTCLNLGGIFWLQRKILVSSPPHRDRRGRKKIESPPIKNLEKKPCLGLIERRQSHSCISLYPLQMIISGLLIMFVNQTQVQADLKVPFAVTSNI